MNEPLIHSATWMNLKNSMLSEKGLTHVVRFHLFKISKKYKSTEKEGKWIPEVENRSTNCSQMNIRFLFWVTKKLKLDCKGLP